MSKGDSPKTPKPQNPIDLKLDLSLIVARDHVVQDSSVRVRLEKVAVTLVELVHVLDPVKSEAMEEALQAVHEKDDAEGSAPEGVVAEDGKNNRHGKTGLLECVSELGEGEVEEHLGELTVCKGEGPESQVGSSVGDGTKHELNGLDQGVDHGGTEAVLTLNRLHGLELLLKIVKSLAFVVRVSLIHATNIVGTIRAIVDASRSTDSAAMSDQLSLVVLLFVMLSAEHHARLDAHEDGDASDHAEDQVGSNSLSGAPVLSIVVREEVHLSGIIFCLLAAILSVRLAAKSTNTHANHGLDDARNSRVDVLVLSLESCLGSSNTISLLELSKLSLSTIERSWVVNISLGEPLHDNDEVHVAEKS